MMNNVSICFVYTRRVVTPYKTVCKFYGTRLVLVNFKVFIYVCIWWIFCKLYLSGLWVIYFYQLLVKLNHLSKAMIELSIWWWGSLPCCLIILNEQNCTAQPCIPISMLQTEWHSPQFYKLPIFQLDRIFLPQSLIYGGIQCDVFIE